MINPKRYKLTGGPLDGQEIVINDDMFPPKGMKFSYIVTVKCLASNRDIPFYQLSDPNPNCPQGAYYEFDHHQAIGKFKQFCSR